jgi:phosphopantothenoylcysteine decarboxylase/phosphopantothenate--cysteine ligase
MVHGRKILLGVTGSIAAFKAVFLARELMRRGAEVRVVMTAAATEFVGPLTFATLTGHRVYSDFTEDADQGTWTNHVDLGLWADLFLVAPATAETLAAFASGACSNFLQAVHLSSRCEVMVAPAMDLDMFAHGATQQNLLTLRERGVSVVEPGSGMGQQHGLAHRLPDRHTRTRRTGSGLPRRSGPELRRAMERPRPTRRRVSDLIRSVPARRHRTAA